MKSFGLILGSSGTGKGTRMNQLIKFLETKYAPSQYIVKDKDNKDFNLGLYFKELDLLILGKYVDNKQANTISWSSMDSIWSKFGGTEPTVSFIKTLNHNILCEGYANMDTFRVRPAHMSSEGCNKFFYQVYSYGLDGYENYLKRIVGRSGKEPKGTTAFEKEAQVLKWYSKIINDLDSNKLDNSYVFNYPYDEDISSLGEHYLDFIGNSQLKNEFLDYCVNHKHTKEFNKESTNISNTSGDW